jgi:hypothetical protein
MSDTTTPSEAPKEDAKAKVRYFETPIDGLEIHLGDKNPEGGNDPALLESVRATRYTKKFRGDTVRVGLFALEVKTNAEAIKRLEADGNVTELTEKQYTVLVKDPETKLVG